MGEQVWWDGQPPRPPAHHGELAKFGKYFRKRDFQDFPKFDLVTRVFVPQFTTRPKIKWENKSDEMVNLPGLQLITENSRNSENISGRGIFKIFQNLTLWPEFLSHNLPQDQKLNGRTSLMRWSTSPASSSSRRTREIRKIFQEEGFSRFSKIWPCDQSFCPTIYHKTKN